MDEEKINWKNKFLTLVIGAIITIATSVVGGLLLNNILTQKTELIYLTEDAIPFKGVSENMAIYTITILNSGSNAINNVICSLSFSNAKIEQHGLNIAPSLNYDETSLNNSYRLSIPDLNPQIETLRYQFCS